MNYNFTDRVRKVLAMAREEAIRLQHDRVGTEHILLGLIREGGGLAVAVVTGLGLDPMDVKKMVEGSVRIGREPVRRKGELPYTSRAKKVLEFAMREAGDLGHSYVGTEHLLLGLLREAKGTAAEVLNRVGVTSEGARRQTLKLLSSERDGPTVRAPNSIQELDFAFSIDDNASTSIYEQLVAQAQEAIATGRLREGDRLPTVRHLADQLDIAPGTVARAYSELERLGVVVTEGVRGTRVAAREKGSVSDAERPETLVGLLRPSAVASFHLGATADELRTALERAMDGIFWNRSDPSPS